MSAIYKRELRAFFSSPIGYIFVAVFFAVNGALFNYMVLRSSDSGGIGTYYMTILFLFIIIIPLLTMKLFSDERRQHTEQLLLSAPAALEDLPAPDGVFVGGSGGELDAILAAALGKNPRVRLCVSAIALETLSAAAAAFAARGLEAQVTQIWAARSKGAGGLNLMMGQNPVWLISGRRREEEA